MGEYLVHSADIVEELDGAQHRLKVLSNFEIAGSLLPRFDLGLGSSPVLLRQKSVRNGTRIIHDLQANEAFAYKSWQMKLFDVEREICISIQTAPLQSPFSTGRGISIYGISPRGPSTTFSSAARGATPHQDPLCVAQSSSVSVQWS